MQIVHIPAKTENAKRALVCYLPDSHTLPADHPNFVGHSNYQECRTLLTCLSENGFACDVIGWNDDARSLIGSDYDLMISIFHQLEYGKSLVHENGKVILYSTSWDSIANNLAEYDRLNQLRLRRKVSLLPRRQATPFLFADQVDEIWCFGNEPHVNSYSHIEVPKYKINISTVTTHLQPCTDMSDERKKHFLWFGSVGALHKGLDWLLEIFARNPDLHLHICGQVEREKDFYSAYEHELKNLPNIHYHGWTLPNSDEFEQLSQQCAFVVMPSCAEGCSGATLQCMALGLIPIVTKATSVCPEFGFILENDTLEELEKIILSASSFANTELAEKSLLSHQFVQENHTLEHYKSSIMKRVKDLHASIPPSPTTAEIQPDAKSKISSFLKKIFRSQ